MHVLHRNSDDDPQFRTSMLSACAERMNLAPRARNAHTFGESSGWGTAPRLRPGHRRTVRSPTVRVSCRCPAKDRPLDGRARCVGWEDYYLIMSSFSKLGPCTATMQQSPVGCECNPTGQQLAPIIHSNNRARSRKTDGLTDKNRTLLCSNQPP